MRGKLAVIAILLMALIGATTPSNATAAESAATQAGVAAADSWLKLVDRGDYRGSYKQASSLFRGSISEDDWAHRVGAVRQPMGALISRKQQRAKFHTTLPGAPDGQYVVVMYQTSFDRKHSAVETVTAMLDQDGQWHVSGYYLK